VQGTVDLKVDVSEFLTFADFFFDGFIMDYVVQTKIAEARRQIEQAIPLVEGLVNDLKYHYGR
jgi:hypothetical protein